MAAARNLHRFAHWQLAQGTDEFLVNPISKLILKSWHSEKFVKRCLAAHITHHIRQRRRQNAFVDILGQRPANDSTENRKGICNLAALAVL